MGGLWSRLSRAVPGTAWRRDARNLPERQADRFPREGIVWRPRPDIGCRSVVTAKSRPRRRTQRLVFRQPYPAPTGSVRLSLVRVSRPTDSMNANPDGFKPSGVSRWPSKPASLLDSAPVDSCNLLCHASVMDGLEMRTRRQALALTQHELAERLGVSRKTVAVWEGCSGPLDRGVVLQILEVCGRIRLLTNVFGVEITKLGDYAVVHRRAFDGTKRRIHDLYQKRVDAVRCLQETRSRLPLVSVPSAIS